MQYVLIVGNPKDGHSAFGPFYSESSARGFAQRKFPDVAYEIVPLNIGL